VNIRVFRALHWRSSVCGWQVTA